MAINVENVASFKFIAHKVMPLVYDESLSYYEFLCKVMKKLNEVISSLDNQNDILQQFDSEMQSYELELDGKFEQFERDMNALFDQLAESEVDARELFEKQIKEDFYTFASSLITPYDELLFPVYRGTYCWYEDACYRANQDIDESEEWDSTKWDEVIFVQDIDNRVMDVELAWEEFLETYQQNWNIVQETGESEEYVMSQKAVTDELDIRAKVDGAYPELLAGDFISSEKLDSNTDVCIVRETGEGLEYVGTRSYPAFLGATVRWNQLIQGGDFSEGWNSYWSNHRATVNVNNNIASIQFETGTGQKVFYQVTSIPENDVVLISFEAKENEDNKFGFWVAINDVYNIPQTTARRKFIESTNIGTDNFTKYYIILKSSEVVSARMTMGLGSTVPSVSRPVLHLKNVNLVNLTALFGSSIANYIYGLSDDETRINTLKKWGFITENFYDYNDGELESVCIAKRKTYNEYDELIGDYNIDDNAELRGLLYLDENNELQADGDKYIWNGTITREYAIRDYIVGDEDIPTAITDGTHTVYKLTNATTDSADPFEPIQLVADNGKEIIVDGGVSEGTRDVAIPCGYDIKYSVSIKKIIEDELPIAPTTDGTYTLKCTVADGVKTFAWVGEE